MSAALLGVGEVRVDGRAHAGGRGAERAGLAPLVLAPRKVWRCSTARRSRPRWRCSACSRPKTCSRAAIVAGALSVDAAGQRRALRRAHPRSCAASRARSTWPHVYRALLAGSAHPRLAPRLRQRVQDPYSPALPAAGDGRLPRPDRQRGAHAADRGQRRHRQPAGLRRDRAKCCRAATSTPSRWPSPPTPWRWRSPRSARCRSGASRC